MIVDSSAVVSVLLREDGHEELSRKMREAEFVAIGAPTLFETEMVMFSAMGSRGLDLVISLRETVGVEVVVFDERHSSVATEAFAQFGKGHHRARLNFGDCMTYATARSMQQPLLFVGDDFARTDLEAA